MKVTFGYLFFLACLFSLPIYGQQPSKEDIDALLKKTQKMIDSLTKAQKIKNAGNKGMPAGMGAASLSKLVSTHYFPPPKNDRLLGALPNKKLSPEALKPFITGIDKKLTALLNSEGVRLPPVEQMDAGTVCQSAIMDLCREAEKKLRNRQWFETDTGNRLPF